MEESSKRAAKIIACPCRKHVGGYTAGVCLNTNICLTHAPQRVARSRIVLSIFLQPIISYRVRLHDDCLIFSFQSPIRYFFAGMQTFARNPKSTQFQFSRILTFQPHIQTVQRKCLSELICRLRYCNFVISFITHAYYNL